MSRWRTPRPRERRRTVAACLAAHGLISAPRPLEAGGGAVRWGVRFAAAAVDLGPAFILFARHLATRPDLLAADDLLALEELGPAELAASLPPPGDAATRVAAELDRPQAEVLSGLEPEPVHRGLLYEEHRARLCTGFGRLEAGSDVVVRLRRPGLETALASGHDDLHHLRPAFPALDRRGFDALVDDFHASLADRLDLRAEATALNAFAEDVVDSDLLTVPRCPTSAATPRLSIRQALPGERVERIAAAGGERTALRRGELVRRLHLAWLQQALVAGHVPVDTEWVELADGRLAVVSARFERVTVAARPRLWSYLRHVAAHRPEDAYDAVAGELRPLHRDADPRRMRLRLRQLVPFRDGGWSERRDTLAELLALHWRLAREEGFAPSPSLAGLWTGVYQGAVTARRLETGGDPLRSALDDLRWLAGFRRLHQLAEPSRLGASLESNLAGLMEVPQKLDRLLQLLAGDGGDGPALHLRVATDGDVEQRRGAAVKAVCLGLLMAAVALLAWRLPSLGMPAAWVEPGTAVAFLVLGALLLHTITRR